MISTKNFIYALIARDPKVITSASKYSVFWDFLPEQDKHNWAATKGVEIAQQQGFFDSYYLTFSINKTKKPFILPMCGVYSYMLEDAIHLNLPVSPRIAITMVEAKGMPRIFDKNKVSMYEVKDEIVVDRFNGYAFRTQCNAGLGYVVSPDKPELEKLSAKIHRKDRES